MLGELRTVRLFLWGGCINLRIALARGCWIGGLLIEIFDLTFCG